MKRAIAVGLVCLSLGCAKKGPEGTYERSDGFVGLAIKQQDGDVYSVKTMGEREDLSLWKRTGGVLTNTMFSVLMLEFSDDWNSITSTSTGPDHPGGKFLHGSPTRRFRNSWNASRP